VSAFSSSSLSEREAGLKALQELLHDEILRSRQARDAIMLRPGEDSGGLDEWFLRMCVVQALLQTRREAEALDEARVGSKMAFSLAPPDTAGDGSGDGSGVFGVGKSACVRCSQLLLGVCLLRRGIRAEGISVIEKAAYSSSSSSSSSSMDPTAGGATAGTSWLEGLRRWALTKAQHVASVNRSVESIRQAALDAYARGSFADAVNLYSKAIAILQAKFPDDKRGRATAYADKAGCQRRGRKLAEAVDDLDAALRLFPHYTR
jgi:tetratricopeptide (TPR) repeat protein